jgi:hypothetical protein
VVTSIVKCWSKNSASPSKISRLDRESTGQDVWTQRFVPTRIVVRDLQNRSTLGSQAVASVAGRSKGARLRTEGLIPATHWNVR